jgi:hypothetical protein
MAVGALERTAGMRSATAAEATGTTAAIPMAKTADLKRSRGRGDQDMYKSCVSEV